MFHQSLPLWRARSHQRPAPLGRRRRARRIQMTCARAYAGSPRLPVCRWATGTVSPWVAASTGDGATRRGAALTALVLTEFQVSSGRAAPQ